MNAAAASAMIDPKPVLDMIREHHECTFEDAIQALMHNGATESAARDALWQLLSDGTIVFTTERNLAAPAPEFAGQAAV